MAIQAGALTMSMMINSFDPGYSVSVVALGGAAQPRWGFTRVPMAVEPPKLPVAQTAPARIEPVQPNLEDDCERWDGLS